MLDFVKISESANHCQRNWSEQPVDEAVIQQLISVAINMPTKQNEEHYKLLVSTSRDYNEFVYLNGYNHHDTAVMDIPFENRHYTNLNTQLRAPVLFQWFANKGNFLAEELYSMAGLMGIGISAGAVALVANSFNLKTGFCICVDGNNVVKRVNELTTIQTDNLLLTLGVGYPREDLDHNICIRPNDVWGIKETHTKNIKVYRL